MKKTTRFLSLGLALVTSVALLTGCGGGGAASSAAPAGSSAAGGSAASGSGAAGDYTGKEMELEVNLSATTNANCQYLLDAFDRITARTGGKVKFKVTMASGLLSTKDALEGLGTGVADISDLTLSNYPESFVYTTQICSQPFMGFKDIYTANDIIRDVLIDHPNELMEGEFKAKNIKVLQTGAVFGAAFICKNDISLYKPTELKGLKVMTNDFVMSKFINGMGGAAVDHAVTDMYSDLSNGVVDCALNGANIAKIFGAINVSKCLYRFSNDLSTHIKTTCINLDKWNSFDDSLKKIFTEEMGAPMYKDYMAWVKASEDEQWKSFEETPNFKVYDIKDDQIGAWKEAIAPYANEQLAELKKKNDKVDDAMKIWREAIDNYYKNH